MNQDLYEARLRHFVEQAVVRVAEDLHDSGVPCHVIDGKGLETGAMPQWDAFQRALVISAAICLAQGESTTKWMRRQIRRWGAVNAVRAAVATATKDQALSRQAVPELLLCNGLGVPDSALQISSDQRTDIPASHARAPYPTWAGIADVEFAPRGSVRAGIVSSFVDIEVLLPEAQRGAHMSRLQEAVETAERTPFPTLVDCARWMAEHAHRTQSSQAARVAIRARQKLPWLTRHSRRPSSVVIGTTVEVLTTDAEVNRASLSVAVDVMTACPCTLEYSRLRAAEVVGDEAAGHLPPTFTHSQPGVLTVSVSGPIAIMPSITDMFEACAQVAHLRESVLKRPDEHDLVERVHRRPQFTEDLARGAAANLAARVDGSVMVRAEAKLSESIHSHAARSLVEDVASALWARTDDAHVDA